MYLLAIAAMAMSSTTGLPADRWNCRNQLEVWCAADGCAATPPDEFTPMDIHATAGAAGKASSLSVCAYSGCWESSAAPIRADGRLLWTADGVPFSSNPDGAMTANVTLLILTKDGVGFVRVGGLATPLLCQRVSPAPSDEES
ncbi:MAG TPA: hypothetical protein PLV61_14135 [Parvularculaceae bacterium]|nr:hypothetical protein [Amphiplicatus sp.]MCB9954521.1 hypothetical protein [Caulobacterales bacterium]HPE32326.1 hypothetical protein [Parvularculaceae bacterium]